MKKIIDTAVNPQEWNILSIATVLVAGMWTLGILAGEAFDVLFPM